MDCPSCACLIDTREGACPFCGATTRSAGAPAWLVLGLALGVGLGNVGCVVKGDGGDDGADTVVASDSMSEGSSGVGDQTTSDPSNGDGVTYAGPDESWSAGDTEVTTTSGPNTTTTTTTTGPNTTDDSADASTYAGPDESWSASDVSTSSSSDSSGSGSSGDTSGSSGDTGASSSGSSG